MKPNPIVKYLLLSSMTFVYSSAFALKNIEEEEATPRIQSMYLNKSSPQKIFLAPGLASSIQMPCEIDEVVTPSNGIMKNISERNKTRFSLEVSEQARSTNFIVHCVSSTYVFDLIVNRKTHNDFIEIIGDYGSPRLTQIPPRIQKESFIYKKQTGSLMGIKSNGEERNLEAYTRESDNFSSSESDYQTLNKIKIYSKRNEQ